MKIKLFFFIIFLSLNSYSQELLSGKISFLNKENKIVFLEGASVYWKDSSIGVISDKNGNYSIPFSENSNILVVKMLGFKEYSLIINDVKTYDFKLIEESNELNEVIVSKRKNTIQKSYFKTQNIVNVSSDELLKAACCNVSESFETNPSIDVSYSNAITGVKQVRMLGLESPYLLITEENIPMVRGASQVYGLSFIPGPWVESMQITKGTGSVVNGFESISGQINIELKKPVNEAPLFINVFRSGMGRNEFNFHLNKKLNPKLNTIFFVHADNNTSIHDDNSDGFLDHPTFKGFNFFNRYQYTDLEKGIVSFLGFRYMKNDKKAGEDVANLKLKRMAWVSEIKTDRFDSNFKLGYVNPRIPYRSTGFQMAYSAHNQKSFFGLRDYNIKQNSFYSSFLYNSIIGNTMNKIKTGLNFYYDDFEEIVDQAKTNYNRIDKSIGGFFEYSYDNLDDVSLVAGLRYDIHNNLGSFLTPRMHVRYQPFEKSVLRFSIGSGRKSSNIFSENQEIFSTGREIKIKNENGNFYGLNSEKALNYGLSFRQGFNLNNQDGDITIDYYVTNFENQIVVDWEKQGQLSFYNLEGKSYAKSFQIELDYSISNNINFKSAFKNYNVKKQYNSGFKQNPLTPKNRFFINIDFFSTPKNNGSQWKFDFTYNRIGKQRLPIHSDQSLFNGWSPSYTLLNSQLTRVFSENFEIYFGGENIGSYTQENPILSSENPFGMNFDSTLVYAPIIAPMLYLGIRLKL
ncbi:MAG: TonB-dependent receptor [Flavobacteriaceae bacterium]|nr:TonB-dependent receptor [Flavobacteriaceae bacterium]